MPPEPEEAVTPVPVEGDGILTVPDQETNESEEEMAEQVDLSPNVANQLLTESVGNIQADNRRGRDNATVATGVLQGAMARNFDELGTVEGRANSGVIATPVAGPTLQAPGA
jgi:hypothetical protein